MNKNRKRNSKKNADRRTLPSVHVLIAVIAIIECLVLLSFTTYSWIESNSSLVIMNGPQTTTVDDTDPNNYINIDIADTLNYEINLDNTSPNADLNTFYRFTENFRYGKTSSADGKTFYFPKRNNTYSAASTYRKGDTTDYNTSYTYFDFYIKNTVGNRDFFFSDKTDDAKNVFTLEDTENYFDGKTYTDGGQTKNKLDAIKSAMRLSISTEADNQTTTTIYSPNGSSYSAQNGLTDNISDKLSITTEKIEDYGINKNKDLNANSRKKLFTSTKSSTKRMKVSVRVWFEIMDPDFQKAFGFGTNQSNFNSADFNAIAGVAVNVNLTFANSANNYVPFYFDDYTFDTATANTGNNMTLANANNSAYKVWFHVWNPDTNAYSDYEMERDTSVTSSEYTRWEAQNVPQLVTDHLQGSITTAHLNASYFTYGTSASATGKRWYLYAQPGSSSDFVYKAYSQTTDGTDTYGVGAWDIQMTLVRFNDMATRVVTSGFNNESSNFKYMNAVANAGANTGKNYVFVNNTDAGNTYANNFTADVARTTAAMYYDSAEEVFKAYVPSTWVADNGALYFNFSINGQFSQAQTNARYFARNATAHAGTYQYTALGVHDNYDINLASGQSAYAQGVGTWNDIEKINFSTELIDAYHKSAYRYFVSVGGSYGRMENTAISYPMVPDAANMVYSAYIPAGLGSSSADLSFCRHNGVNTTLAMTTYNNPNVSWAASTRGSSATYYPVNESASTSDGYWNLSVLVDGTYENLIYDTLTDADALGTGSANTGMLEYSLDSGTTWTTLMDQGNTDINRIDAYRWYVPCNYGTVVQYRWTPYYGADKLFGTYDDTAFYFTHDTANGMYCVVTESGNEMTYNSTPVIRRSVALAATGFDAQIEQSIGESAEAEDISADETDSPVTEPDIAGDENTGYDAIYEETYDETMYQPEETFD
ncbi:MAG: hypothetical protein IJV48_07060 [Ruminococcus sp.]|nr:hypothetical protein [Ruminococcus sp.]